MTNFDKIKAKINAMTIEDFIDDYFACEDVPLKHQQCKENGKYKPYGEYNCRACQRDYLESEVDE